MPNRQRTVVVDLETTGLSPLRGARVIEIGAVAVENCVVCEEYHTLIDAGCRIPLAALQVHGITELMLRGQPEPEFVWPRFRDFLGDSPLVAHNAAFDLRFLRHEFGRFGLAMNNNHFCTLRLSRRFCPELMNHRLETVYRHLCGAMTSSVERHRALADARLAAGVWIALVSSKRNGRVALFR